MFLGAASNAQAKTLYLDPGVWNIDGAKFAIYYFNASQNGWSDYMSSAGNGIYQATVPDSYSQVIFCRMNPNGSKDWNGKWNQTEDQTIPSDKNQFNIEDWTGCDGKSCGTWSVYGSSVNPGGGDTPGGNDPVTPSDYDKAVPDQCEDVMLQAFYWKSNINSGYGDTKWETLSNLASEIGNYFDLVWLPPSAQASGISQGGLGYIPLIYSNQACLMGKSAALKGLISALHDNGVRVIADIVINHIGNESNNCDGLKTHDFGSYGSYSPTKDWLTRDDEGGCGSNGNYDDGQHTDKNFGSARDWDHKNTNVQAMCRAYLKWMRAEMKYDGWRYDMVGGYHAGHINDYNTASKPYFSVIEYWLGDANVLKQRIDDAGKNTLAFDFAAKYDVFRDGIFNKNYDKCKNGGMRGKGYSKYAVTFIDNHDTFNRGSDNEDVANKRDGSSINDQSLMMRCHVYLLSMPGVPCVFYPHWVKYKSDIQKMITARKKAGIHSESSVEETSGSGWYRATVYGKHGNVKLMLGSAASDAQPTGYTLVVKGSDYAMYYVQTNQAIENVEVMPLDVTQPMFTVMGQQVDASYRGIVIQNGHKYLLQ